jgi:uncharacterized membrane protein
MDLAHFLPPMLTAFLASFVECIEALTVILAVGAVLGWHGALGGAGSALALLLAIVVILGPLVTLVPLQVVHLGIGALLLVFGVRWLRKAVLRAAGIVPLRDESAAYAQQSNRFRALRAGPGGLRQSAWMPAFQVTMVEGVEVIFIVVAVGAAGRLLLWPAGLGALGALFLVSALGVVLHRPLARVPENALKFTVGVLTCAFGLFWLGEGVGVNWPGEDGSVLLLAAAVLVAALVCVRLVKRHFRVI